ncbi:MAG TPA: hypothetical protein PK385_05310 [Spirochaetota bacterium]|jgi:hypothetical protein|nr:MAG: hypothetical protein BWX91_00224 [Spirochaetes bacterium ADurb.Bin133]HNZ25627.1 hypothetical protein [Spirochaetota bacterium]HOF00291.1 hypothetical protein [Spirochaetota bacterium]HOS32114.1 hypothetical protein [Spirochaetota bacterium]HOS55455.1 hypothetical protein [Spirochaetota bacterium]
MEANFVESELNRIENSYQNLRKRRENIYLIVISLYFMIPLLSMFILSRFYNEVYNRLSTRIVLFTLTAIGVVIHFIIKFYIKQKGKINQTLRNEIDSLKYKYGSDDFENIVLKISQENYENRGIVFSKNSIKKDFFWNIVFEHLKISIAD